LSADTPLDGLLVVDCSRVLAGPFAAMMLGDLGARVVKVERPVVGDDTRHFGPPFVGTGDSRTSTYFCSINRNKESIALDLAADGDRDVFLRLVAQADVLIENFRPGVMERLGLEPGFLRQLNERLVILSITGFGHDGPDSTRIGYDQIVQGESGLMSVTGPNADTPSRIGSPISDVLAGLVGISGVLAALERRHRTGEGDVVRTSLLSSSIAAHTFQAARWLMADEVPTAIGNRHPTLVPYQAFACKEGLIQIAIGNDEMWRRCAPLVGIDGDDPRFERNSDRRESREELTDLIAKALEEESAAHWVELFRRHGVPAGEVKSLDQVFSDPQALSQGAVVESEHPLLGLIRMPGCPVRFDVASSPEATAPPMLDEHGSEIRAWLSEEAGVDRGK
jgi:crotonobetainyl-CoA:carnitine CoA-transferase CaiB-like acyl-CoA transferase